MGGAKRLGLVVAGAALIVLLMGAGSASATLVCKSKPMLEGGVLVCPEKSAYGMDFFPETWIAGGLFNPATFTSTEGAGGTVECTESTVILSLKMDGTSEPGEGITNTTFTAGGTDCMSTLNGGTPRVTVTPENMSYDATNVVYEQAGAPQGTLTIAKSGGIPIQIKWEVRAKTVFNCIYRLLAKEPLAAKWENTNTGTPPTKATFTKVQFERTGGNMALCPGKVNFSAEYLLKAAFEGTDIFIGKE
ncbi:MAG TPA: hypothetical protein VF085_11410 [Solirubrobacterales bacterium]